MSFEQPIKMCLVAFGEMISPPQEGEAGSEQVRFERWRPSFGFAALYLPPYQGEALGEPAHDMKAVQHMAGVGQILSDGCLI